MNITRFKQTLLIAAAMLIIAALGACASSQETAYLQHRATVIEPSEISPQHVIATGAMRGEL